jgi:hypothetical protein
MTSPVTSLAGFESVIAPATRAVWPLVAESAPPGGSLMGGTALAVHLRHRVSRDLDVFSIEPFAHDEIEERLRSTGASVERRSSGGASLDLVVDGVLVQFVHAPGQQVLQEPTELAGMRIGSPADLCATKLRAIGGRAELRDYFDLMCLETLGGMNLTDGFALYLARYGLAPDHVSVRHILEALGYLDDVADDPYLEQSVGKDVRGSVSSYWRRRQPDLLRHLCG